MLPQQIRDLKERLVGYARLIEGLLAHARSVCEADQAVDDLVTSIGEDVVYMVDGRVIKHHREG